MANNFAAIIKETWSTNLQDQLRENFVGRMIANTKFDWSFTGSDTVNFPRQAKLTIGTLADFNASLTEQDITTTNETFVLDQIRYFAFRLNIIDRIETYIDPKNQTYKDSREGFSREDDRAVLGQYANAGYVLDDWDMEAPTNLGAGNPIITSKDNIFDMVTAQNQILDEANVPENDRFMILDPIRKRQIKNSPLLNRATTKWDDLVRKGFFGDIDDTNIWFSNGLTSAAGTIHALWGQGKPVSFASNLKPQVFVGSIAESSNFTFQVKGATKFGVKTFTEWSERLVDIHIKV